MSKINTSSILSGISSKTSKGTKLFKAVTSTFYKEFGKVDSNGLENKINDKFPIVLNTFAIADSIEEINRVYREVSHSCMYKRNVGAFYIREGYECAYCLEGRAIIDPQTKTFVKSYGFNHYVLESILTLMGYTKTDSWTRPMNMEVDSFGVSDSDIPRIVEHYKKQLGNDFERVYGEILAYEDCFPADGTIGMFFHEQFSQATYYRYDGEEHFYSDLDGFIPYQVADETIVSFIPYIDGKRTITDEVVESILMDFQSDIYVPDLTEGWDDMPF